jgi:hypothetical protein
VGQFAIQINAIGAHGCERKARTGEKLFNRCGKFGCADCMAYDFVQMLRVKGFQVEFARFVHHPGARQEVVDDLLVNERKQGAF